MSSKIQKQITRIVRLGFVIVMLATLGCDDSMLEGPEQVQPQDEQILSSESDAASRINAVYASLRWTNTPFAPLAVESLGSDEAEKGSAQSDAVFMNDFDHYTASASEAQLSYFWSARYESISLCNQLIDEVDGMMLEPSLKAQYVAEAKFVRAYNYFRLVRAFGDVPLKLTNEIKESESARTPKANVWAAIEKDLSDAADVLPQSYSSLEAGHATIGAALALHAKVAMYQSKWSEVANYTNAVMQLGYQLFPDYEALFRIENENNVESVFEIQASLVPGDAAASNSEYSQVQGVRGSAGGGMGFNVPTQALVNAYEKGDPRMDATILFRGETTPEGDVIPMVGDNPMYNQKSYVPFAYWVSGYAQGCQQNIRVIRYADVLLMNAEANNELGNTATALASLEMVRARARGGDNKILPAITTTSKSELRTVIWHERQVELAMEFDRYFDVIRQGRGEEVFGAKGWKAGKNEVWPIPQTVIDASGGSLAQNAGY